MQPWLFSRVKSNGRSRDSRKLCMDKYLGWEQWRRLEPLWGSKRLRPTVNKAYLHGSGWIPLTLMELCSPKICFPFNLGFFKKNISADKRRIGGGVCEWGYDSRHLNLLPWGHPPDWPPLTPTHPKRWLERVIKPRSANICVMRS